MQHNHVRRGDTVAVIAGRERGKRGKVLRVLPVDGRVLVEKLNMMKKHQRPTQKLRQGGIIERESPLALSNVLVVCSRCDKPSRSGIKVLGDGRNNYNRPSDWVLREIKQKAKQLIWLNPESRMTWGVGDSEMPRYAPNCHIAEECRSISQLYKIVDLIVP